MKCASAFKLIVDIGHFHLSPEPKHENAIGSTSNKLLLKRITTHNISKDMIVVHLDQLANLRGSFLFFF